MKTIFLLIQATFVLLMFVQPAFAYIDPGSGTMILQAIVLAFVGGWFAVKNYWNKILGFFRIGAKRDAGSAASNESSGSRL